MGGVRFFTILSQVTGKDAPAKSRNVSSLVSGCFCSAQIIKSFCRGRKNRQLGQLPVLLCTFPGRGAQHFSDGVGEGRFPTQGTSRGEVKGQISLARV